MKTEKDTIALSEFSLVGQQLLSNHQIKCKEGNEALNYCVKENCQDEKIFLCQSRNCQCRISHRLCLKAELQPTIANIKSKITDTTVAKEKIHILFDNLINKLSQIRESILLHMDDESIKYEKLHTIEKEFLRIFYQESNNKFTSKQSAKLWQIINSQDLRKFSILQTIQDQLNKFESVVQNQNTILQSQISKALGRKQTIEYLKDIFKVKSSILSENLLVEKIVGMFNEKIDSIELIFKASEHDFSLAKYYELCGDQTHTMIICKTNMDKVIGGYTPLSFNPDPQYNGNLIHGKFYFVADDSASSMLFTLSENDKFELVNSKRVIRRYPLKNYLMFGNSELSICEKSNLNAKCQTFLGNEQFPNAYSHPEYKDDKQSYLRMNGNETESFSTKQWQVWKINFE